MKTNGMVVEIVVLVAACVCRGQTQQWDRRFGGSAADGCSGVQQTKEGGYILGGSSVSGAGGDKTQASRGGWDYWAVKVDASGAKQWDRRLGGMQGDFCNSVQQTKDGGYILGGYSFSDAGDDRVEGSRGVSDYWIVKLDADGTKLWDRRFGGASSDLLSHVRQTPDGGYILAGYTYSGAGGDKSEDSRGGSDYWMVKVDADGTKQWDRRFGGEDTDVLNSLALTPDGGYILGGYSASGVGADKTEGSRGNNDYWIVKVATNGVKQWDKRFGGSSDDQLTCLQATLDGGYILGGYSHSGADGDKTEATRGGRDFWIVKIDARGAKQWDRRFGGADTDSLHVLRQVTDGGFLLGGESNSGVGGDKTVDSRGSTDNWIVKVNANGGKQWDRRFGGSNVEMLCDLWQTADGGYLMGGYSHSGLDGDKSQASRGESDFWIVKILVQAPDAYEPDGTQGTAKGISNGRTQSRSIHEPGDVDWAKMVVGRYGATGVRIQTSGAAGDTELTLIRGRTGAQVAYNDDAGGTAGNFSRVALASLSPGTYFIKVGAFGNNVPIAAYQLRASWVPRYAPDAYEPDNGMRSAKRIRNGQTQRRTIHMAGNRDWAKFTIGGQGARDLLIQTAGAEGDTQMWLYDSVGTRLRFNDDSGPGRFSRITAPSIVPGTYYVRIQEKGNNGTIPLYSLKVRWTAR